MIVKVYCISVFLFTVTTYLQSNSGSFLNEQVITKISEIFLQNQSSRVCCETTVCIFIFVTVIMNTMAITKNEE